MSYQALYRVWRPRTFQDLVGQSHITRTLQNALATDKFSHAYLFSGPRGTGKTSAAKIFAQTLNCEQMPTKEPCNECAACRGILDGSISDVIEIDAASNTSVEDIRDIREKVKYASSAVPYKVYIIDEVHMISVSAFNALLKTLEEPPPHVVFILATTEPHKIPLTIISRCQRFDFKSINNQVIVNRLTEIMQQEEVEASQEALETVALHAEGGMRDALSILDQTISYTNDKVEIEDVLAVTGGVSQDVLTNITDALFQKDTKEALRLLDDLVQNGKDPGRFVFDYIYFLRDVLFYKTTSDLAGYMERAIVTEAFRSLTEQINSDWVQTTLLEFTACEQQIKWTNSPKVFVEIAMITITSEAEAESVPEITTDPGAQAVAPTVEQPDTEGLEKRIAQLEKQLETLSNGEAASSAPAPKKQPAKTTNNRGKGKSYKVPFDQIRSVLDTAEKKERAQVQDNWEVFLRELKQKNAPAHATIQDSKPAAASADTIVAAFKYDIHCSLFLDHQEMAESILANVLGKQMKIIPIPEVDWYTLRNDYLKNNEPQEGSEEESQTDPLVDEAKKLFGEDTVEVQE